MVNLNNPVSVVVTGAGRGLGKSLCVALAAHLQPKSVVLVMGRNQESLEATKVEIAAVNSAIDVIIYAKFDCAVFDEVSFAQFLNDNSVLLTSTNSILIVHNAGTVGDPAQKASNYDLMTATEYMVVNFSSMVSVNNILLKLLQSCESKTIVQITSLAACQAVRSLGLYCSGKAARDMFFEVLAAENPAMRVLNYAPGPLDTEMFRTIGRTSFDGETKNTFNEMKPLKTEDTCEKLVTVLKEDKFKSGSHVDYYDPLPE